VKNPNKVEEVDERSAAEILESIASLNAQAATLIETLKTIGNERSEKSE
jgi:hypothetical protein